MENFKKYLQSNTTLSNQEFEKLSPFLSLKKYTKGAFLLKENEICQHIFFVEKGLLKFYSIDEERGYKRIIQFAPEDWLVVDRASVFYNKPSKFFIEAIEPTEAVAITAKFIDKASEINDSFRSYNEQLLQNHIRHLQNRIDLLLGASAEEKYLDFIQLYPDLIQRIPQWMIASYLGIKPESLSRVRKELAQK